MHMCAHAIRLTSLVTYVLQPCALNSHTLHYGEASLLENAIPGCAVM